MENKYKVKLLGGDTVKSDFLFLSLTVGGFSQNPILRNGAKAGDKLYMSGNIGGSKMGFFALQNGINSPVIKYHLNPEIRCEEALVLREKYRINSMIDISDGLLIDSNHLSEESKKQLNIQFKKIPTCPECNSFAEEYSLNLKEFILTSGEEFELLFTSPDNVKEDFVSEIGYVSDGKGVYIDGKLTSPRGYLHFGNGSRRYNTSSKKNTYK